MANEQIPLTNVRRTLGEIVDKVRNGDHIEIAHHGHPVAVLVPIGWYDDIADQHGHTQEH